MAKPKTRKQLRGFLGLVNYYRDMTQKRSELIAPLTRLTSTKVPFIWTKAEDDAFEKTKLALSQDTLLAYPDFN